MREIIASAMKTALKEKDQVGLSTIRLISAALKDRDIAARSADNNEGISDDEILSLMQTMIKQRNESIKMYEQGNRPELAAAEQAEIAIIQQFLPAQLSDEDVASAIADAITETGANSVRDMGKVMGWLKPRVQGRADMGAVTSAIKQKLSA